VDLLGVVLLFVGKTKTHGIATGFLIIEILGEKTNQSKP